MEFGQQIKILRKNKGLTQKQLAKLAGISPTYLCDIEKGRFDGSLRILQSIATALDVELWKILKDRE